MVRRQFQPVEGPLEDELASDLRELRAADMFLQQVRGDLVQPAGPLLQPVVLLEDPLHLGLHLMNDHVVALAHPRRLLLSPKHAHAHFWKCVETEIMKASKRPTAGSGKRRELPVPDSRWSPADKYILHSAVKLQLFCT